MAYEFIVRSKDVLDRRLRSLTKQSCLVKEWPKDISKILKLTLLGVSKAKIVGRVLSLLLLNYFFKT